MLNFIICYFSIFYKNYNKEENQVYTLKNNKNKFACIYFNFSFVSFLKMVKLYI